MFTRPTVLILGAASSFEVGMPLGATLLQQISGALTFKQSGFSLTSGEQDCLDLVMAMEVTAGTKGRHHWACQRIIDAAEFLPSIDHVIHQNSKIPEVAQVGKAVIAKKILEAESESLLAIRPDQPAERNFEGLRDTWFHTLAEQITTGVRDTELETIFDNLSIITFNYDRTIEHFLFYALQRAYGLSNEDVGALMSRLPIVHPYGRIGRLQWEAGNLHCIPYGQAGASAQKMAEGIKTFTEQLDDEAIQKGIGTLMSRALNVIFIGFGFHQQNIELLKSANPPMSRRILGTAYGLSDSAREVVSQRLSDLYRYPDHHSPTLSNRFTECGVYERVLFGDNWVVPRGMRTPADPRAGRSRAQ